MPGCGCCRPIRTPCCPPKPKPCCPPKPCCYPKPCCPPKHHHPHHPHPCPPHPPHPCPPPHPRTPRCEDLKGPEAVVLPVERVVPDKSAAPEFDSKHCKEYADLSISSAVFDVETLSVECKETVIANPDPELYSQVCKRTFVVTDPCGNQDCASQLIYVLLPPPMT